MSNPIYYICTVPNQSDGRFVVQASERKYAVNQAKKFRDTWFKGKRAYVRKADPKLTIPEVFDGYRIITVPFSGFVGETKFADLVEHEESQWCEYEASDDKQVDEDRTIPERCLEEQDFREIIGMHADYSKAHERIADDYVDAWSYTMGDELGVEPIGLHFESMDSHDPGGWGKAERLYAYIHPRVIEWMMAFQLCTGCKGLSCAIANDFKPRSGFVPSYTDDVAKWLDKPIFEWDHNELSTLMKGVLFDPDRDKYCDEDHMSWRCYEALAKDSYDYFDQCVNWDKVNADILEARDDKENEAHEDDPDWPYAKPEPRCNETMEMFRDQ